MKNTTGFLRSWRCTAFVSLHTGSTHLRYILLAISPNEIIGDEFEITTVLFDLHSSASYFHQNSTFTFSIRQALIIITTKKNVIVYSEDIFFNVQQNIVSCSKTLKSQKLPIYVKIILFI